MELADMQDLESCASRRVGSTPTRAIKIRFKREVVKTLKVEVAAVEGTEAKKDLTVEIPAEQVKTEFEKTSNEIARYAKIPGFRPGKAPIKIVKQKFAHEIKDEVRKQLMQKALYHAVSENHLHIIGYPKIEDVQLNDGEPFTLKALIEIVPNFDLKEYKGIPLTKKVRKVTDEDVNEYLEMVRDSQAEFVPVEDRESQDGDFVIINIHATFEETTKAAEAEKTAESTDATTEQAEPTEEDKPKEPREIKSDNIRVEIGGKETILEFTENLRGVKVDDVREFPVQYKEDYFEKDLAGNRLNFKISVVSISKKELPEVNDEFAKSMGDYENLDKLREDIRERLVKQFESVATDQLRIDAADFVMKEYDFEAPESMINDLFRSYVNEMMHALQHGQLPPDFDFNGHVEKEKESAKRNAKFSIVLGRIADKEHITISERDVEVEIAHTAARNQMSYEQLKARLTKNDAISSIEDRLMYQKVLDLIVENAQVTVEEHEGKK